MVRRKSLFTKELAERAELVPDVPRRTGGSLPVLLDSSAVIPIPPPPRWETHRIIRLVSTRPGIRC